MSLNILILTDGKQGDLVQCRGVANNLTEGAFIHEEVVQPNWITALPLPSMPLSAVDRQRTMFSRSWDMVIASGRRTIPYLRAFKKVSKKPPFTVFLKDPVHNRADIDVIWTPEHDKISGTNIFSTLTSPHGLSAKKLSVAGKTAVKRFNDYPSPSVGVVLGGNSKTINWTDTEAQTFADTLKEAPAKTCFLIVPSRRTPDLLLQAVEQSLSAHKTWVWNDDSTNPYVEILAYCDQIVVTGDSHNMVSEALATGKPVHIFHPPGLHKKLEAFLVEVERTRGAKKLAAGIEPYSAQTIDATKEISTEILRRFNEWSNDH